MSAPSAPIISVRPLPSFGSIEFWWSPPSTNGGNDILSYTLLCSSISYSTVLDPNSNYTVVSSLTNCIDYTFQIAATNEIGDSPYAPFRIVQPGLPPSGVSEIGITFLNPSTANVYWTFSTNVNEAATKWFNIRAIPSTTLAGVCSTVIRTAHGNERSRNITNISSSQYTVFVQAINDVKHAYPTPQSMSTAIFGLPTPFTSLSTVDINSTFVALNWSGGIGSDSYTYYVNDSITTPSVATISTATFTNLESSTEYTFIIQGTSAGGQISSQALLVTTITNVFNAPSLSTTSISTTAFTIEYSTVGASSYFYNFAGISSYTDSTITTISSLSVATSYTGFVEAINIAGSVSPSTILTIVTLPTPITNLIGSAPMLAAIGWNTPSNPTKHQLAYSYEGITWYSSINGNNVFPFQFLVGGYPQGSICSDGYMFIAGTQGRGSNCIAYSLDGITWSMADSGGTSMAEVSGTGWGNGTWLVAGGYYGGGEAQISRSTDGRNWTESSQARDIINYGTCVAYGNGIWVAGDNNGGVAYSSDDGITWTHAFTSSGQIFDVQYNGTIWVLLSNTGIYNPSGYLEGGYYTSSDGISWSSINSTPVGLVSGISLYWNGTVWAILGYLSIAYSSDTITWSVVTDSLLSGQRPDGITWLADKWVVAAYDDIVYSYDGITWAESINGASGNSVSSIFANPLGITPGGKSSVSTNQFSLSWSGGIGITYYNYSLNGTQVSTPNVVDNGLSTNSVIFLNLNPGTVYTTIVQGGNSSITYSISTIVTTFSSTITVPPVILLKAIDYSGSGSWLDESGHSHNATLEEGTIAKNTAGNGIVLDGSTSWTFPNVAVGNQWSLNVWYKKTGAIIEGSSIITQILNETINLYIGTVSGGGAINCGFYPNYWGAGDISSNLVNDQWVNIQVTWDSTTITTYIDGSLVTSVNPGNGPAVDSGQAYRIGRDWYQGNLYFIGEIGEVRIYNYPITQPQVTADYNSSAGTFSS